MKNVLTAKEIGLANFPERNDISAWVDVTYAGARLPSYKCACCGENPSLYPTPYCAECGSLMVNYHLERARYDKAIEDFSKGEQNA